MNPALAGKRPTVYLDMNAIKVMARAASRAEFSDAAFVYSSEHFTEIQRGNTLFILDALNALQAFEVCITLDNKFLPTDHATFQQHENLKDRYDEHVRSVAPGAQNLAVMRSLVATMMGANNAAKTLRA